VTDAVGEDRNMAEEGAPDAVEEEEAAPPASASDAALARYRSSMRRGRTVYYAILAIVVVALGAWVGVAWSAGEVAHTSLHTVAPGPPTLSVQAPSESPRPVWHSTDRIAIGSPQWGGTIITYSWHSVGGRDARTGRRTWRYTRTDREVCTAAQLTGTTIAIYAVHGNCDELSAFDSDTGRRRWTRTLDMDGMPVNGLPSYQFTPYTLLVSTPAVIYALDPVTGLDRWTYQRFGCRIGHVALGSAGALISQTCTDQVQCKGVKFCGRGPQLLLRDGSAGRDDGKPNADQIKWNQIGDTGVPVSADNVISSVAPSGSTLSVLNADTGNRDHRLRLTPATVQLGPITATATDRAEIIWIAGQIYALPPDAASALWRTNSSSPPVVVSTTKEATPALSTARITVPTDTGVAIVDGNDGNLTESFTLPAPAPGSLVYSLGSGFLVAGPTGMVAYR
jgi:outer membrane protein assembly factor BamB